MKKICQNLREAKSQDSCAKHETVNAKEKILKEIKSAIAANIGM